MRNFRFRRRRHRLQPPREIPVRKMIPNLVTFMAAASGVTSIRYSCQGNWRAAVVAVLVAGVLDGLDGRVARMLRATSKFGAELDSLADFVSFGVAPAILVYLWVMEAIPDGHAAYPFRGVLWALALFYALCAAFRLARFNIMSADEPAKPYWKHFFMGVPSPGGAGLAMTPVIWQLHTGSASLQSPWVGGAVLLLIGVLMACRWPTLSAKGLRVPVRFLIPVLLFVMLVISMLVSQFWLTLGVIGILYLCSVPACGLVFARLRRRYEATQETRAQPAPGPAANP